jgi:hypothetical protein
MKFRIKIIISVRNILTVRVEAQGMVRQELNF